jgi:hypothetical protein
VSEFLVEAYRPRNASGCAAPAVEDVSVAADELTREGRPVRLVRSFFLPSDETCFYLYQATSLDAVQEAATRAGLQVERINEAVSD